MVAYIFLSSANSVITYLFNMSASIAHIIFGELIGSYI